MAFLFYFFRRDVEAVLFLALLYGVSGVFMVFCGKKDPEEFISSFRSIASRDRGVKELVEQGF